MGFLFTLFGLVCTQTCIDTDASQDKAQSNLAQSGLKRTTVNSNLTHGTFFISTQRGMRKVTCSLNQDLQHPTEK